MATLNTGYIQIKNKSLFTITFKVEYILLGKVVSKTSNSILVSKSYKIDLPRDAQSIILTVYKTVLGKKQSFYYEKLKQVANKCYEVSGTISKTTCKAVSCK